MIAVAETDDLCCNCIKRCFTTHKLINKCIQELYVHKEADFVHLKYNRQSQQAPTNVVEWAYYHIKNEI